MRLAHHFSLAHPREVDVAERLLGYLGIPALVAAALVVPTIVIDESSESAGTASRKDGASRAG
jgi:hypothetical protein